MTADLFMQSDALFSGCRTWRYRLERIWDDRLHRCLFVMLNPSTADEEADDPTSRRCIGFARAFGCGALVQCNLFAVRGADPTVLSLHPDPVGPENDVIVAAEVRAAGLVIAAWGASRWIGGRAADMLPVLRAAGEVHCLRRTAGGAPEHPLYLPGACVPVVYEGRPAPEGATARHAGADVKSAPDAPGASPDRGVE